MPAEYTRMFLVDNQAEEKGFFDSPNAEYNKNLFIILQSDNGRQVLVCLYIDKSLQPLSKIWRIIPCGPNDKNALLIWFSESLRSESPITIATLSTEPAIIPRIEK